MARLPYFGLSSHVSSHHLAVAQQYGAKDKFYSTVNYITLKIQIVKLRENLKS
jgi:hypothetical protein